METKVKSLNIGDYLYSLDKNFKIITRVIDRVIITVETDTDTQKIANKYIIISLDGRDSDYIYDDSINKIWFTSKIELIKKILEQL